MTDEIDHTRRAILRLGVAGAGALVSGWLGGCEAAPEEPTASSPGPATGAGPDAGGADAGAVAVDLARRGWFGCRHAAA